MLEKDKNPILFITVGYSLGKEGYRSNSAQLGQLSMATLLYQNGYNVKLISSDYVEPESLLYTIEKDKIGIVAFYTTTEDIFRVISLVSFIKKLSPKTPVFLGGPHVSISQKNKDIETLELCPADLAVRGEGEYVMVALADYFYEGKGKLSEIKGLTYRKDGKIERNPDNSIIENLDDLPIPCRELLDPECLTIERLFPRILTGRGCPFNCAFCFDGMFGRKYRFRSVENVLSEVDYILKTCPGKVITFIDNTFTISAKRVSQICKGLRERRKHVDFVWSCLGRANVLHKNLSLIDEMVESGLIYLQLGVESGDPSVLSLYDKKVSLEQIEEVFAYCEKVKVPSVLFNVIIGGPNENYNTWRASLDFCIKLLNIAPGRAFCTGAMMLSPYPMTSIAEDPDKYGVKLIDHDFARGLTVQKVPFTETEAFNKYELVKMLYKFEEEIKEAMRKLFPLISRETILKHINVGHHYNNISLWLDVMKLDQGLNKYYNLLRHKLYRDYYDINENEILDWKPLRTFDLVFEEHFCVIVRGDGTRIILDEFDSFMYEYCGGKISLKEIMKRACNNFSISHETALNKVINFCKSMSNIFALIFSRV